MAAAPVSHQLLTIAIDIAIAIAIESFPIKLVLGPTLLKAA